MICNALYFLHFNRRIIHFVKIIIQVSVSLHIYMGSRGTAANVINQTTNQLSTYFNDQ